MPSNSLASTLQHVRLASSDIELTSEYNRRMLGGHPGSLKTFLKQIPIVGSLLVRARKAVHTHRQEPNLRRTARAKGLEVKPGSEYLDIIKNDRIIRINRRHLVYGNDIINMFDYYFSAVEPIAYFGWKLVDYSTPRYHDVVGYERHQVYFPSFSEPLVTTNQYVEFSDLKPGSVVIDLGAYSGLTSIIFKDVVGPAGIVVAVDADINNLIALEKNFFNYKKASGNSIHLLYGAVWIHGNGLEFSSEGNMGSSASEIVGKARGNVSKVHSYRLIDIVDKYNLKRVDFIKCDVEGAEAVIFEDAEFFQQFKPRIIIEPHLVGAGETTEKCVNALKQYGYKCKRITQTGVLLPLLECYPPETGNP